MDMAAYEHGGAASAADPYGPPITVTKEGLRMTNNGLRFNLDNYRDLYR